MRLSLTLLAAFALLAAEPAKPDPKDLPKIAVAAPLGLAPGKATKLLLRGLKLDEATEVRLHDPKGSARILSKGKAPLANKEKDDLPRYGDTQVEIEATLSTDYLGPSVMLSVVTPAGESPPRPVMVDREPLVAEKEPNNSFRQAQAVQIGQTIEGVINGGSDVDVFRIDGKEGQQVVLEVFAARYGSALDSLLTLYDADGRIVASNDDVDGTADSRIETTLPKTGVYYVSLVDANDVGSTTNVYRLAIRAK
jgi:Bacterial pre-peptidase C-terminal domain